MVFGFYEVKFFLKKIDCYDIFDVAIYARLCLIQWRQNLSIRIAKIIDYLNAQQEKHASLWIALEPLHDFAIAQFFAVNNRKTRMFKTIWNVITEIYTVLQVIHGFLLVSYNPRASPMVELYGRRLICWGVYKEEKPFKVISN